jgi:carbon storage regulator CsrA
VEVTIVAINGRSVRIGISAPSTVRVDRAEIRIRKDSNADWKPPV